jgi:hypothetical protein
VVVTTIADIEQEVARRAAVWEDHVASGGTANPATAVVTDLLSTADDGGTYPGQWLLRRSAATADRQRRIASVDPATGTLTLERAYAAAPTAGEAIEITPLDPARHLRRAVVAGLARCFFVDRVDVPVTAGRVEEDLSAALFWVTDVGQIRDVRSRVGDAGVVLPTPLDWSRPVSSSGGVGVEVAAAPAGVYVVEALRPHATWVNGADAPTGPALDTDTVACPLAYAAAAGHVELWRCARSVLAPVAAGPQALAPPLAEAAATFTLLVRQQWWYWDRPDRVRRAAPVGGAGGQDEWVTSGRTWSQVEAAYTWRGLSALTWSQVLGA